MVLLGRHQSHLVLPITCCMIPPSNSDEPRWKMILGMLWALIIHWTNGSITDVAFLTRIRVYGEQQSTVTAFWLLKSNAEIECKRSQQFVVMSILRGDTHTCVLKACFWSADLFWQDNTISYCWLTWHIVNTRVLGAGVTNANSVAVWKVFVLFYMKSRTWITRTYSEWIQENTTSQTQNGRRKKTSPVEFAGTTSTLRHKKISVTTSKYFDCYPQAHTKMLHILF